MAELLFEIGAVIVVATALAYAARMLKQPVVLGYIAAGLIIGPAVTGFITNTETISFLSELGIALLLFIVGLEMDFNKLRNSGVKTALMGSGQVLFTAIGGYVLAAALGFAPMEAFYIAAALTFSSTAIVIKMMSDKATLETPYGRVVLGMLLIQDVIAIFLLAFLPSLTATTLQSVALAAVKGAAILAMAYVAAR